MGRACAYLMALPVFAVFVLTGQAEEPCELRTLSSEVLVPHGEWIPLNCTFNCSGRASWETRLLKNNTQWGPNWASVEVLVDDWEKSELYCIQSVDDGGIRQSLTVVMAYAEPSNVTINMDQELEEGKVHQVICIVYDVAPVENLQIQLLKADTVIHNSTFKGNGRRGKQTVNATYEVIASRMDNLQNFSCQASLRVATGTVINIISSSKTVRTYGQPDAPVVTVTPESNIQEGDYFNITCLSDGSPSPEYHWIVPTGADVTYTRNNSVVLVIRAGQIHNGNYTCEARNAHGWVRSSKNVHVIIKGPLRRHIGNIISAVLVFIVTSLILWKTRIRSTTPGDSD